MFKKIWKAFPEKKKSNINEDIGDQIQIIEEIETMLSVAYKLGFMVEVKIRVKNIERCMLIDGARSELASWLRDYLASVRLRMISANRDKH